MPWIHIADIVNIILYCINQTSLQGAINGTAPHPVRNKEFVKTLGAVLKRPAFFSLPATVVKLLFGQMGGVTFAGQISGAKKTSGQRIPISIY